MGSRRLGCPLPTPPDSRALRLGTLTNLFVGGLSFFFFCCIKNNTCEDRPCVRTSEKRGIRRYKFGMGKCGSFLLNWGVSMNQCYPKCGLGILGGVLYLHGILTDRHAARTENEGETFRNGSRGGEKEVERTPSGKEYQEEKRGKRGKEEVFQIP